MPVTKVLKVTVRKTKTLLQSCNNYYLETVFVDKYQIALVIHQGVGGYSRISKQI